MLPIKTIAKVTQIAVETACSQLKGLERDFMQHMDAYKELVVYLEGLPNNTKVCILSDLQGA
jgi:bacterioferritin (cytochrome b1)